MTRADRDCADQDRADQDRADQNRADQDRADRNRADRDRLAAAQAGLLAALLAGAPAPDGFDPERIRVQRNALIAKRRALVARRGF